MEKKLTIKEIEMPYVLVGDEARKFELLCEFEDRNRVFQKVYLEDGGTDVVVEVGEDSAIVRLFLVADGYVGALFDYIEASLNGKDGFVCWQHGEFERLLAEAEQMNGKYPFIREGIGLEKAPIFSRQLALNDGFLMAIDICRVPVERVVDELEYNDDNEVYIEESDDEFMSPPKVMQAGMLPEGWKWVDYPDLSGHLESPEGQEWFQYDVHESYVEFRRDEDSRWSSYPGRFEDFKLNAEKAILENFLKDVGGLCMDKMRFYVIDDLKKNTGCVYFGDVAAAHERFMEVCKAGSGMPALGVEIADGAVDLLHGVGGEAVLVPDIYRKDANWSEPMKAALRDIQEAARWLVMDGGGVSYEYQNGIVPAWMQGDVKVLVPVTLGEKAPSSYCDDKVLKATVGTGLDSIDSLYLEVHGWVAYDELLRHPDEYVGDGVIKVQFLNVNYAYEKNVIGIDGQMDISPCEFKEMVEKINKPYKLVAYDGAKYTGSFRDKHDFIVASFDTAAEAVRGWYEVQARKRVPMLVESHVPGEERVVFNGYDENNQRMSMDQAAKRFGLDLRGLDAVLGDAGNRAGKIKRVCEPDKELE